MAQPRPHSAPTESHDTTDSETYLTKEGGKLLVAQHKDDCHEAGALHDLREKVDRLRMWQAVATSIAVFLQGVGLVVLAWWLSSRLPAPKPERASSPATLIPQAHAETKGSQ